MTPRDYMIRCFVDLCKKHSTKEVADKIDSSEQTLAQIVAGTKLPTGRPRGVGPGIADRLDDAYPGWSDIPDVADPPIDAELLARVSALPASQQQQVTGAIRMLLIGFEQHGETVEGKSTKEVAHLDRVQKKRGKSSDELGAIKKKAATPSSSAPAIAPSRKHRTGL